MKADAASQPSASANLLQCKNFGCAQKFAEAENHESACRHHAQPPTFHDMKKGWSCCSSKMVYDWDDFEKIPACQVGRHSSAAPTAQFAKSPTVLAAEASGDGAAPPTPVLKSIDDYNKTNPSAVTAVSAAVESQTAYVSLLWRGLLTFAADIRFFCANVYCTVE